MIATTELLALTGKAAAPYAVRTVYPSDEGFNIDLYLGFKHFAYLMEEGVLHAFRTAACGPRELYVRYGLNLEVVGLAMRLLTTIHLDDPVRIAVRPNTVEADTAIGLRVSLMLDRGSQSVTAATANARIVLRPDGRVVGSESPPPELQRFVQAAVPAHRRSSDLGGPARSYGVLVDNPHVRRALGADGGSIVWKLCVPYYYCHFTDHLQLSGYWRILEQAVDLFLASRGISIGRFLMERRWIPVVLEARMDILADVWMEEDLYTVLTIDRVHGEAYWPCRSDCYVWREGQPLRTATGHITHAYAELTGPGEAVPSRLDPDTQARLCPAMRP